VVRDANMNPIANAQVLVSATNYSAAGTTNGAGSYSLSSVPMLSFTATASAPGYRNSIQNGVSVPADATTTANFQLSGTISATAGTPQSANLNTAFAAPLQATVTDGNGNPLSGASVTFTAPSSGASATFSGSPTANATTNSSGIAIAPALIADAQAGSYTVTASTAGSNLPASFNLTNLQGIPVSVTAISGTPQSTQTGAAFASALQAVVKDSIGNPISGVSVTFMAPSTGPSASFGGSTASLTTTNTSGVATSAPLTANNILGAYTVTAAVNGIVTPAAFLLANDAAGGAAAATASFGGNAQHTANYQASAQNLNSIHWSTTIDFNNTGAPAHYGAPVISAANTVFVPIKTASNGFEITAFNGGTGASLYTVSTDFVLPSYQWIPTYQPALVTTASGTRLYYAGLGGTIYYISNPDLAPSGPPVQQAFYGLANYQANQSSFASSVFIDTPITADSNGNIFFGFRVQGTAPAPLNTTQSGFARIDPNGNATYVLAGTAAGDAQISYDSHNSAPALSNDQSTLYVLAKSSGTQYYGYLLGLNSTTLATKYKVFLVDPRNGNPAGILDDSTASPMVGPDNDVYIGTYSNPDNGSRGFLLHFSSDLTITKTPGAFGWDYTPGVVPSSIVPSYTGSSSYLIFSKYNNYAIGDGDGAVAAGSQCDASRSPPIRKWLGRDA